MREKVGGRVSYGYIGGGISAEFLILYSLIIYLSLCNYVFIYISS